MAGRNGPLRPTLLRAQQQQRPESTKSGQTSPGANPELRDADLRDVLGEPKPSAKILSAKDFEPFKEAEGQYQ